MIMLMAITDRTITFITPPVVNQTDIICATINGSKVAILMWATYVSNNLTNIAGVVNTANGLDYADTQPGFTGYSF